MGSRPHSNAMPFGERQLASVLLVGALALAAVVFGSGCAGEQQVGAATTTGTDGIPAVVINEFMASNTATLQDASLAYPDWIELYNAEADAVDLSGFWLSDDVSDPFRWQIPGGLVIEGGGYLIIFADGDTDQGDNHASFRLDMMGGEDIALYGRNVDDNPLIDSIEQYTPQLSDLSSARLPDGSVTWSIDDSPTPGAANQ